MRQLYLRKDSPTGVRKIMLDMASLVSHKNIRLPKYYFEDQLYLPYLPDLKDRGKIEKFYLTKSNMIREDENFFYFDFKFKPEQVEETAF
jgi:hypothetical protein